MQVVYVDVNAKMEHWNTDSAVAVKGSHADLLARRVFERRVEPLRVVAWSEVEAVLRGK